MSDTIFAIVCTVSRECWVQSLTELLTVPRLIDSRFSGHTSKAQKYNSIAAVHLHLFLGFLYCFLDLSSIQPCNHLEVRMLTRLWCLMRMHSAGSPVPWSAPCTASKAVKSIHFLYIQALYFCPFLHKNAGLLSFLLMSFPSVDQRAMWIATRDFIQSSLHCSLNVTFLCRRIAHDMGTWSLGGASGL